MRQIKKFIGIVDFENIDGNVGFAELLKFVRKKGLRHEIPEKTLRAMVRDADMNWEGKSLKDPLDDL